MVLDYVQLSNAPNPRRLLRAADVQSEGGENVGEMWCPLCSLLAMWAITFWELRQGRQELPSLAV